MELNGLQLAAEGRGSAGGGGGQARGCHAGVAMYKSSQIYHVQGSIPRVDLPLASESRSSIQRYQSSSNATSIPKSLPCPSMAF